RAAALSRLRAAPRRATLAASVSAATTASRTLRTSFFSTLRAARLRPRRTMFWRRRFLALFDVGIRRIRSRKAVGAATRDQYTPALQAHDGQPYKAMTDDLAELCRQAANLPRR